MKYKAKFMKLKQKNVMVTGAAGFIGSNLVDELMDRGCKVLGIDNLSLGSETNISHLHDNSMFRFLNLDLTSLDSINSVFKDHKFDVIFHFAANSDIRQGLSETNLDLSSNLLTTYNILESMRLNSVKKIVFSSTSAIYGEVVGPIREDHGPLVPQSLYGASKLGAEAYISAYTEIFGFKSWIFRFPNVIGPRLTHGVIYDFIKKLQKTPKTLEVLGDGKQRKPYLYIVDLLDGIFSVLEDTKGNYDCFNIGVETLSSVEFIANKVVEIMNLDNVEIKYGLEKKGWPGDVPHFIYDTRKIRSLGWSARYSSDEAVEKTIREMIKSDMQ